MLIPLGRFLGLILALMASGPFQSTVNDPCPSATLKTDPYHLEFVQSAFDAYISFQKHGMFSFQHKKLFMYSPSLPELGDSVSVSMVKLMALDDLSKKENTKAYLNLVIGAFSDRSRVIQKSDQEARVTSMVLEYLRGEEASNPTLQKVIEYTEECARNFGCTAEAKHYFAIHPDP